MTAPAVDLRYPIGTWKYQPGISSSERADLINQIAMAPAKLRQAVAGLSEKQLATPYRPGGWSVRQLVHHVADSHMNAYIRFKLAMTENDPRINAYDEKLWAETAEVSATPIEVSLAIMENLHIRWVVLLQSLKDADWQRAIDHPENGRMPLEKLLALYAWHGAHHTAHVTELRNREGWGV